MTQMGCESEKSGPPIAHATERPNNTLMGKSATFLSDGDSQPAKTGAPRVAAARMSSHVLVVLSSTVNPKATPAPVIAANPAVTKKSPLGRAIVTASSSQQPQSRAAARPDCPKGTTTSGPSLALGNMGLDLYRHTFFVQPGPSGAQGTSQGRSPGPPCCRRPRIPRAILQGGSPAGKASGRHVHVLSVSTRHHCRHARAGHTPPGGPGRQRGAAPHPGAPRKQSGEGHRANVGAP